jgi:hypothetical protein
MSDRPTVTGEFLHDLNKRGVGLVMLVIVAVFAVVGGVLLLGADMLVGPGEGTLGLRGTGLLFLVLLCPLVAILALGVMQERLVATTDGIFHVDGNGWSKARVKDAVRWEDLARLRLEILRTRKGNRPSTSYYLVFERASGGEPLRYLVGIPHGAALEALGEVCKERGVPVML